MEKKERTKDDLLTCWLTPQVKRIGNTKVLCRNTVWTVDSVEQKVSQVPNRSLTFAAWSRTQCWPTTK